MTARRILEFPDPRLRVAAAPVRTFDDGLSALADDLLDTMRAAPAIGITASHIGVLQRLTLIELSVADGARIYVNPRIEWTSSDMIRHEEGSVSMPGVAELVERPPRIRVRYQELTGASRLEEAEGLLAVCLQHEIDQLDGVFWTQRLTKLKRERLAKSFEKLRRRR